jgi:V/A-type H+-transporting ATPase subunit I
MLLTMTRIQVIGLRAQLDVTVAALARLGVLHIEDATRSAGLKSLALDEQRARLQEDLSFQIARLDALLHLLPPIETKAVDITALPAAPAELTAAVRQQLDQLVPSLQELAQRRDQLQAEALALPRYESLFQKLLPLAAELRVPPGSDTLALLVDSRYRDAIELLRVEVEHLAGGRSQVIAQDVDERTTAALVVFPHALSAEVHAALEHENITQVRLPKELAGRTYHDARQALEQRRFGLQRDLDAISEQLAAAGREWRPRLLAWRQAMTQRLHELVAQAHFGATEHTFVIEGWLPSRDLPRLRAALARDVGDLVVVHELPISAQDQEHAPVAFDNPEPLKPFERLVRTVGMPGNGAFDPTLLVAIFLPLFFGIIVGDIGYGALLLLAALYLRHRFKAHATLRGMAQMLLYGSGWAIAWGVLYGEVFGTLQYTLGSKEAPWPPALWFPRTGEEIVTLFAFAIGVGALHVVMGLLLGLWEAWRARQRGELVTKIGKLVALSAIFGMVGVGANFLPSEFFTPTIVGLIIGVVLLIVPAGPLGLIMGPLELVKVLGNIMSYLRLAAVGLASVYIALVANEMVGALGNIVLGGIIALLLHALNFAILMLSPSIQSLRLHYVEFFSQFYKAKGEEYRPFRAQA